MKQTRRNSNVKTRQKSKYLLRANKYNAHELVNILNAYVQEQPNAQTKELKEHGAMHKVPKVTSTQYKIVKQRRTYKKTIIKRSIIIRQRRKK